VLRPAVPHLGGKITSVSRPNQATETVSQMDGNTGSFQVKSNSNSASTNSVTESATTYKEKQIHVSVSDNNTENRPNAVIYLRVSSKKQADEGYSIASQDVSCNNYAQLKNYNVAKIFIDEGVSATIHLWNRPAGKAMREYIEKNNIQHIIVVKMDRLFRSVRDLLETVDELTEKDIGLHLVEFSGQSLDTTSAMGRFFLTVIGAIGELESGQISERTKQSVKHMKRENKRFTGEIYGWDCNGDGLTPNWHEQCIIDYIRDMYYGYGCSGYQIATILNELGDKGKLGGKWRSSTVLRTINYEFHKSRDKPEFIKPTWWSSAPFTDTIPWGTTEFLNLYLIKKHKSTHSTLSQPKPTVKNRTKNTQKPVDTFSGEVKQKASERTDINYADYIRNWGDF